MSISRVHDVGLLYTAAGSFLGILCYYTIAISYGLYPTEQPFPFFSWFLFSAPPTPIRVIDSIRIIGIGGKKLDEPVILRNAREFVDLSGGGLIKLEKTITHLSDSVSQKQPEKTTELRRTLESYFRVPDVEYEVVVLQYDLLEYLRENKVRSVSSIAAFRSGSPS